MVENSIIKIEIPLTSDYTKISNKIINDKRLSGNARTLLAHMLIKPQGQQYSIKELIKSLGFGQRALILALKELEKYGYVEINDSYVTVSKSKGILSIPV